MPGRCLQTPSNPGRSRSLWRSDYRSTNLASASHSNNRRTAIHIPLDRQSATPLYHQIENYLRQNILAGNLAPETRLPASRRLAQALGVNRITVETAYAALESDGLVFSRLGSGTYVLPPNPLPPVARSDPAAPWPLWQQHLQARGAPHAYKLPGDLLAEFGHPHPISFASGTGDPQSFPADEFRKTLQSVMRRDGIAALEYGDRRGYLPLRNTIAHILASQGLPARPESVLITAGSQQALALVAQTLLKPGDVLLVESPTYSQGLELFNLLDLNVVGVPVDEHGMQVERLERLLQQYHPRLIYTIPNFHNPTGVCLSAVRRRQLIVLADRYNVPILEDDFVGDLRYEGRTLPALKSLDPGGQVIYVSTFSKMLIPGLRVGFLLADGPVYERLVYAKHTSDLATSNLIQRALEAYVTVGRYQTHLRHSCLVYRKRLEAMLQAIHRHLPASMELTPPQGGLFVWLRLPGGMTSQELLPLACQEGVAFAPGWTFYPPGMAEDNCLRLNFITQPPDVIDEGIRRLGRAIRRAQNSKVAPPPGR